MTNLSLLACAEGLGTCWIAAFKEDQIKQILGIQKGRVVAITPLGYAVEKKGPVTNRKSLDELVQFKNI
jgi:nitroreductase